mmetsp:Transcript_8524/g.35111  ORF Transcript_8524/g.35111 Transcript_8524/m.35111 type:complete len:200 (-) Transcript_8524:244-843(-)
MFHSGGAGFLSLMRTRSFARDDPAPGSERPTSPGRTYRSTSRNWIVRSSKMSLPKPTRDSRPLSDSGMSMQCCALSTRRGPTSVPEHAAGTSCRHTSQPSRSIHSATEPLAAASLTETGAPAMIADAGWCSPPATCAKPAPASVPSQPRRVSGAPGRRSQLFRWLIVSAVTVGWMNANQHNTTAAAKWLLDAGTVAHFC